MASKRGEAKVRVERTPAEPDLASSVPWYRLMVLTRRFEDEAERAFRRGKIGGDLLGYSGQKHTHSMGTSVDRSTVVTHLASKFGLHGIENEQVDGQDFLTVRRAAERIVARVRATGRPYAIEAITYRLVGHGAA